MVKISVIVPVYNVSKYIALSVKSICNQEFNSFELILVDDGCKDNSISIAEEIICKYSIPYKIIRQENKGLPAARNTGIRSASGEYLAFIDSDDIIEKSHLSSLYNLCKNNKLNVAFTDFEFTNEDNREGKSLEKNESKVYATDQLLKLFVKRKPAIHCCSLLVAKGFIEKNNIYFNEKLKYGEDVEFMWRLFPICKEIGATCRKSYKYMIRNNSIMTTISEEKGIIFLEEFYNTIKKSVYTLTSIYSDFLWNAYARNVLGFLKVYAKNKKWKNFYFMYKSVPERKILKILLRFPDLKVRFSYFTIFICPQLFWFIFK